ncbi:MAG: hypothetical protein WDZ53_05810, partial [Balneolales bacterium]
HTWENGHAMNLTTGYPTYLYKFSQGATTIVCPLVERYCEGHCDIATPYGFSGFSGNDPVPAFQRYWKAFAQKRGYVCGYIGLNPLFENPSYLNKTEVYSSNRLYMLNLNSPIATLFNNLHRDRRKQLRGYEKKAAHFTTDKALLRDFFVTGYPASVQQKKAAPAYHFSPETLNFLIDQDNVLMVGAINNGELEAAAMFAYTSHVAEALLLVLLPERRHLTMPILWYGLECLKLKNIPLLNMGGGIREGDSVAEFKQRLGGKEYKLHGLKQIYDQENYRGLCRIKNVSHQDMNGYFPPYRKPLMTVPAGTQT